MRIILVLSVWAALAAPLTGQTPVGTLERSLLLDSVASWLEDHPEASLTDAAAIGNELIPRLGFPFDLRVDIPGADLEDTVLISSSLGPITARMPSDPEMCAEILLYSMPVTHAGLDGPDVLVGGRVVRLQDPERVSLIDVRVFDTTNDRELPRLAAPRMAFGNPVAVSPEGDRLYWRAHLTGASVWWSNVRSGAGEGRPSLVLSVGADGSLEFVPDVPAGLSGGPSRGDATAQAFARHVGDFFDRFDGGAFLTGDLLVVYDHPCT